MIQPSSIRGFTLVELMVVIVIIAMLAGLLLVNTARVDERKAMQAREILMLDLQRITQESQDQSKILALTVQTNQNHNNDQYNIVEYRPLAAQQQKALLSSQSDWIAYPSFQARELPRDVSFRIEAQDHHRQPLHHNTIRSDQNMPILVWLGNGEVKPVTIQFFYQNKPVGAEIHVDYLGHMNES